MSYGKSISALVAQILDKYVNSFTSCGLQFRYGNSTAKCICEEFDKALAGEKDQFIEFRVTREAIFSFS